MTLNLLENVSTDFISFAVEKIGMINLDWLGSVVQWLIEGVGIVGLGVILFTLILKSIMLPLDVYSRVKMKKQSLIMKKMRPQMEKLQKQYANDKAMYSQKVMELQKENGISMVGACLPMLVTLVVFMVVFGSFSTYSQYANLSTYNNMVDSYNRSVNEYVLTDYRGEQKNENGFLLQVIDESLLDVSVIDITDKDLTDESVYNALTDGQKQELEKAIVYRIDFDAFKTFANLSGESGNEFDNKAYADKIDVVRGYVKENARKEAADFYRDNRNDFIWVGNVWYPDSMLNKEMPNFTDFSNSVSRARDAGADLSSYSESYDEVTFYLRNAGYENVNGGIEGNTFNGYFVLIVLAIGLMFLQQFIAMRSQKDANELGTVDGTGARTNKWMLIMMPIIYGVFSFFYSAAFSLYMITNTLYGLVTMLLINKIMDVKFAKAEANGGYEIKRKQKNNRKRLK